MQMAPQISRDLYTRPAGRDYRAQMPPAALYLLLRYAFVILQTCWVEDFCFRPANVLLIETNVNTMRLATYLNCAKE